VENYSPKTRRERRKKMKRIIIIHDLFDDTDRKKEKMKSVHRSRQPAQHSSLGYWADIPQVNMPNPASVYCEQNGNKLEIHTAADGSQNGVCVFPDGSTCDEWAYYRGECGPAVQKSPSPALTGDAAPEATAGGPGANASGGYMPPGTSEE
jgi:putative hemolysin